MRVFAVAGMASLALSAAAVSASGEARYTAVQCHPGADGRSPSTAAYSESSPAGHEAACQGDGLGIYFPGGTSNGGVGQWTISAPAGTYFSYVSLSSRRNAAEGWRPRTVAVGTDDATTYIPGVSDGQWHPGWTLGSFKAVGSKLVCRGAPQARPQRNGAGKPCLGSWGAYVFARQFELTVRDPTPPVITHLGGSLLSSGTRSGVQSVTVTATDQGGGVRQLFLRVNGTPTAIKTYSCDLMRAAGKWVAAGLTPCPATRSDVLSVNTAAAPFRTGVNSVQVCAADYSDATDPELGANVTCSLARQVSIGSAGSHSVNVPHPPPPPSPPPPFPVSSPCTLGSFSSLNPPGACGRPYSAASPFNRLLPSSPQLAPNSSALVSALTASGPPQKLTAGNADTTGDWSHPIYFSQPSDPLYTVHCTQPWGTCEVEGMQVRIPAQARPAGGDDGHLAAIDQASGWEYDFWQVQQKPAGGGTLLVSWGGRTRIDGDGLGSNATAAHFGLAAGVIRPAELAAGRINHALFMVVRCSGGQVWPAAPGTGAGCANAPAMGQHFYLGMTDSEISGLNVPAWQKTILRAMARYGMFVGDNGGGEGWGIQFESGSSFTSFGAPDPWPRIAQQLGVPTWDGEPDGKRRYIFDFRDAVNWATKLKVADPCVSAGSCG